MNGYILLHRRLCENPRSSDPKWMAVVIHMLMMASHTEWESNYNGCRVKIKPGQFTTGARVLGEKTGVQKDKVTEIWDELEADGMIKTQRTNKYSLITFLNWSIYQNPSTQTGTQARRKSDRNKEGNNEGNKESGPSAEEIYAAYPRKVGKSNALKAINKAMKTTPAEELLQVTELFAQCETAKPAEKRKFTPYPASWFNGGHYADDPSEWDWPSGVVPMQDAEPRKIGGLQKVQ